MEVRHGSAESQPKIRIVSSSGTPRKFSRDQVTYRLAQSRADLDGAFRILQKRYAESGLTRNFAAPMRVMPYHLWSNSQVFVAVDGDRVIGTLSLVRDGAPHGLPMESTYRDAIERLRAQGSRLGEVCCLCVGSEKTQSSGELFAGLTRMMMFHARYTGLDSLVAVVHPRHGKFYRLAMGFSEIGGLAAYRQVAGQPGVPILGYVNVDSRYRDRWRKNYFEGTFTDQELKPRSMSPLEREYFANFVGGAGSAETRRAA